MKNISLLESFWTGGFIGMMLSINQIHFNTWQYWIIAILVVIPVQQCYAHLRDLIKNLRNKPKS